MSQSAPQRSLTASDIRARKGAGPLVCLTAYTTPVAQLADADCDLVLVGDSVGMVLHGLPSTLGVTMEMMVLHGRAVAPFGSYEDSPAQAFRNAARLMAETGAGAVKLEGGAHMEDTIRFIVERGIPVMAHIGLTPQAVNALGGYKVQGRGTDADRIAEDARAMTRAGAFSVVLEKVPAALADQITADIAIPTVGIGASAGCDGQILVIDDMLGLFDAFKPKFVKRYADLAAEARTAIRTYAEEVRARSFPAPEHVFSQEEPGT